VDEFPTCNLNDLIGHAVQALPETDLEKNLITLGVVGKDQAFRVLTQAEIDPFLQVIMAKQVKVGDKKE